MKSLKFILCTAVLVLLAACGSGGGYDPKLCEELSEKISNREDLTEKDYNQIIEQTLAINKVLHEKTKDITSNTEKLQTLSKDAELENMFKYAITFGMLLEMNKSELSPENLKKLEHAEKEFQEMSK